MKSTAGPATKELVALLLRAKTDGEARARALTALRSTELFVATWRPRAEGYRTLINAGNQEALAAFTSQQQLDNAAQQFRWTGKDGLISTTAAGADLVKLAIDHGYAYIVVDVMAPHATEIESALLQALHKDWAAAVASEPPPRPLAQRGERRVGRIPVRSQVDTATRDAAPPKERNTGTAPQAPQIREIHEAAPFVSNTGTYGAASIIPPKLSERPRSMRPARKPTPPKSPPPPEPPESPPEPVRTQLELAKLRYKPDEPLLAGLVEVLRRYPEIEWAAYCEIQRAVGQPSPAVGLRIVDSFRDNVTEMLHELVRAGRDCGVELDAILVDDATILAKMRERGVIFFPWKPKD